IQKPNRMSKLAGTRLSELTINKLKIHSIGMIGREEEIQLLLSRLQIMMQQSNDAATLADENYENAESSRITTSLKISTVKKQLILVKGFAGVGKTSLARAIKKDVTSTKQGFFVEGKFDFSNEATDQPYSGIAKAYSAVIQDLWKTDRDMLLVIGQQLCDELGRDVEPLTFLVPELEDVVTQYSTSSFSDGSNMDGMQERWNYSFRILTRLLTSHVKPLVILIDDLQWADQASLDLIDCLITDNQNVNPLMFIGCYRSNEVDETSILSKTIKSLEEKTSNFCFDIFDIEVDNCSIHDVNRMVMKMMDTDDEDSTRDLAGLCFQRTLGNPYFVIEFMSMLRREDLITFNLGTMKWVYDVSAIANATVSTANVVELLKSRMQEMPADVQFLLQLAACLGPTLRVPILQTLWKNLGIVQAKRFKSDKVPTLIGFIEKEMLIEEWGGDKYRWVHDKVQEAALSLVEMDVRTLKFEMGKVLYFDLRGKDLDDDLFDVADLISSGNGGESADFASICLKAGKKAMRLSAFLSSTRYIQSGIRMLPENNWTTQQALTLELYTLGAQVELLLGRIAESKQYCSAVLNRDDIELSAKIPVWITEIRRLSTVEMKYPEAVKTCLALLKDMKYQFIWSRSLIAVQALRALSRTTKAVKQQPKDFFLKLGSMDGRNRTIVEIFKVLQYSSFYTQETMQLILCACHIVQLTLKHGLCEYSATNIASLGNLGVLVFHKHTNAAMFREVALSTQNHIGKARACATMFLIYQYTLVWTVPLQTCTEIFYEAYIKGMQNGEVSYAMWCLSCPIDQMAEECPKIIMHMEELSQTSQAKTDRCFLQMFLILQNNPQQQQNQHEHPIRLKGNFHSIDACTGDPFLSAIHNYMECQLLLFYDHPSAADRAIIGAGVLSKAALGSFDLMQETFHRAISLYVAARRTKTTQNKYKKHAKKVRTTILNWKKEGIPNVVYYCIFLDAEHAVLEGKLEDAETHYKNAIQFVCRSGYLHHAGLFNELYSDFLWREKEDKDEARYHLKQAIRYYEDWGALGVVARLQKSTLLLEV
ncbi:MAG: hypothetical protein SGBAC_013148, partial [Bacillariaceae sp.]